MQLVKPEVEQRGIQLIRDNASKKTGESIGVEEAVRLSQIDNIFGQNKLRQQNIPYLWFTHSHPRTQYS